jgi:hypothetical protein
MEDPSNSQRNVWMCMGPMNAEGSFWIPQKPTVITPRFHHPTIHPTIQQPYAGVDFGQLLLMNVMMT